MRVMTDSVMCGRWLQSTNSPEMRRLSDVGRVNAPQRHPSTTIITHITSTHCSNNTRNKLHPHTVNTHMHIEQSKTQTGKTQSQNSNTYRLLRHEEERRDADRRAV